MKRAYTWSEITLRQVDYGNLISISEDNKGKSLKKSYKYKYIKVVQKNTAKKHVHFMWISAFL